ncbi:juvenile hormone esterase-like isoform X1 [Macrobrachium rosenbergii]|uniref:juvenile hormone esterase-like isoform X1 n=1 Tax=Macrobrachium rosenbergii TaxID=79674 RepID=UPI0034D50029
MNVLLMVGFIIFLKSVSGETLEVKYSQGTIDGVQERYNSREFYAFKGIPYAKPPVGKLRFKDPVGNVKWNGKRKGDSDPPPCPQLVESKFVGSEDCLYLNVYTPQTGQKAYPVMVLLHGGDFLTGAASEYSPLPIMYNDVVLVIPQFRLGILGFLSAEDEILPGNLGLKDQTLALRWVKDNIGAFGGDSSRVTIFGSGSGGASVHYQILTPYAKGLFTGAIIQSGSALCPRMLRKHHAFVTTELTRKFLCCVVDVSENAPNSEHLLRCLKNVSAESLTTSYINFLEWQSLPLHNVPRVDGDYIPDHPAVLLKEGRYNKVNIIAGFNQHDGSLITSPLYSDPVQWKGFKENFISVGPLTMGFDEEEASSYLAGISYLHYMTNKNASEEESAERLTELYTDRHFGVCLQDMLDLHVRTSDNASNVYFYQLMYKGRISSCDNTSTSVDDFWVCHGDDVHYLFDSHFGLSPSEYEDDQSLGSLMVKMWTNFATHQNPTPTDSLGFLWEPYTLKYKKQLELKPGTRLSSTTFYNKTLLFWHSLSTEMNRYLNPDEIGKTLELGGEDKTNDLDNLHEPVFKTILLEKEKWTKDLKSIVNKFLTKTQEVDSADRLGVFEEENARKVDSNVEDLIAAAGLWSIDTHPEFALQSKRQNKLSLGRNTWHWRGESISTCNLYDNSKYNLDEVRNCGKSVRLIQQCTKDNLQTDTLEDVNVYNLIQAGLLKASIVLKGYNEFGGDDVTHIVDKENLKELIRDYGDYVADYLKEQKVNNEDLSQIKELYLMEKKNPVSLHKDIVSLKETQAETIVLEKPEVIVDGHYSNKKKINYGKVENFLNRETNKAIPYLVPSGGN